MTARLLFFCAALCACNQMTGLDDYEESNEDVCAPDCDPSWIGNWECDDPCNVEACDFDDGDCSGDSDDSDDPDTGDTEPTDTEPPDTGDTEPTDTEPPDTGDIEPGCSTGCTAAMLSNTVCDEPCNTLMCAYDGYACGGLPY
jgi:hypothetical protein